MKYKTKNTPPVGIFLTRKMFNTMFAVLGEFIESENRVGKTDFSHNSSLLKQKILMYSRAYSTDNDDHAAVYLFEKEAAALIELLIVYVGLNLGKVDDKYENFKIGYDKKKRRT